MMNQGQNPDSGDTLLFVIQHWWKPLQSRRQPSAWEAAATMTVKLTTGEKQGQAVKNMQRGISNINNGAKRFSLLDDGQGALCRQMHAQLRLDVLRNAFSEEITPGEVRWEDVKLNWDEMAWNEQIGWIMIEWRGTGRIKELLLSFGGFLRACTLFLSRRYEFFHCRKSTNVHNDINNDQINVTAQCQEGNYVSHFVRIWPHCWFH